VDGQLNAPAITSPLSVGQESASVAFTAAGNSAPQSRDTVKHRAVGMHLVINSAKEVKSRAILFLFSSVFPALLFLHEMFSLIKTYLCPECVLEGQV
jgi:hypothetical protein